MEDKISTFPDEILFHIVSSIPFESAIQTIFLSKRWRNLWEATLIQHGTEEDVASAISGFLANFNEQDPFKNIRKFKFHFNNGSVLLATIAPNNKLHLEFSIGKQEFDKQFKLLLEFNKPLKRAGRPSLSTATFFIRSLHLISVNHVTNKAVSSILTNFQFLETLKITGCNCLQSLSIISDAKLLNLKIFDCLQLENVTITCSKLRTLRYRGLLPSFWLDYHYNLTDAFLDFRQGPRTTSFTNHGLDLILLTIKNVKVFTLCKWTFRELIIPWLSNILAEFQFYYLKVLWWIENSDQECDSDTLISFLKLCPSLERLFVTVDPKSYFVEKTATCSMQEVGKNTKLQHPELVKLDGFKNQEDEIILAENLGEFVTSEPIILALADGICLWRLISTPLYQAMQKRTYISVEVTGMNELSLKHVHMDL